METIGHPLYLYLFIKSISAHAKAEQFVKETRGCFSGTLKFETVDYFNSITLKYTYLKNFEILNRVFKKFQNELWNGNFVWKLTLLVKVLAYFLKVKIQAFLLYPPASKASGGVYWNQGQKNFTHPYTD